MTDQDIHIKLGEIGEGVKYLCKSVDELKGDFKAHVTNDNNRFTPLENAYQQSIGRKALWMLVVSLISAVSGYLGGDHGR